MITFMGVVRTTAPMWCECDYRVDNSMCHLYCALVGNNAVIVVHSSTLFCTPNSIKLRGFKSNKILALSICTLWVDRFYLFLLQPTVDGAYELVKKRTFLPMLLLVGLFLPLLIGLFLLYPWIKNEKEEKEPPKKQEEEEDEETELIPVNSHNNISKH